MSFFKNLFNNTNDPDITLGYENTRKFFKLLEKKQFDLVEKLYTGEQWDGKSLLLAGFQNSTLSPSLLQEWLKKNPDSSLANLCIGVLNTKIAWDYRTSQLAKYVTDDQADAFFEHLQLAHFNLQKAALLDSNDANTISALITVHMGLEIPIEESITLFEQLKMIEPAHMGGHLAILSRLTPKWGGSLEEMIHFAEKYQYDTPELLILPLISLINQWENYHLEENIEQYKAFFKLEGTKEVVRHLYERYLTQNHVSLLAPILSNYLALVLFKAGFRQEFKLVVEKFRGKMYPHPWSRVGITNYSQLLKM